MLPHLRFSATYTDDQGPAHLKCSLTSNAPSNTFQARNVFGMSQTGAYSDKVMLKPQPSCFNRGASSLRVPDLANHGPITLVPGKSHGPMDRPIGWHSLERADTKVSGKIDMNVGQLCTSIHRSTNGGQFAAVSFGGKRSGASARASSVELTRAADEYYLQSSRKLQHL